MVDIINILLGMIYIIIIELGMVDIINISLEMVNIINSEPGMVDIINIELVAGMGCFWGAEKLFWSMEHVYSTQVGRGMHFIVSCECVCVYVYIYNILYINIFAKVNSRNFWKQPPGPPGPLTHQEFASFFPHLLLGLHISSL